MFKFFVLVVVIATIAMSSAFAPAKAKYTGVSTTKLFENFNLDFKNPKIETDPLIFTEKQLREYTAQYSVDERINPIQFLLGLFKKEEEKPSSGIEKSLKASISLPVLEEKTSQYVKGKIDAKTYYGVLKSAFGDKLKSVLPEILANLPKDKAAALSKF